MAIVVRGDSYDQILTPLAYAYLGTAAYDEVDVLFVNWAVRLLSSDGFTERLSGASTGRGMELEEVKEAVREAGFPAELDEVVAELDGGGVNMYGCSLAAAIFGVSEDDLRPEADGIRGANWFLTERAESADVFMQF